MNIILVPTDFSENSLNAAVYAVGFAKQVNVKKIIIYHAYTSPANFSIVAAEPIIVNEDMVDFAALNSNAMNGLKHFEHQLKTHCELDIEIELIANYGFFTEDIQNTQKETNADIIIMSITKGGVFTENIIGSDAVIVARKSEIPVVIVPQNFIFTGIKNVLLASDFTDIKTSIPASHINKILNETNARLNIVHIANNGDYTFNENSAERFVFEDLFEKYNPEFHFIENFVFTDGVNKFSRENDIDLVVVVPKKHNLIESLFTRSHTKELAFHCQVPMMVVHS